MPWKHFFADFGFLRTVQIVNFHEMGGSRWNRDGQVSVFGYECESEVPPSACVCPGVWRSCPPRRALTVLTWGPLSHLQAGVEGREGEGCGTVGLLLEHSFEIGESSNVLVWALTRCPVKSRTWVWMPLNVRHAIHLLRALRVGMCLHYSREIGAGRA